MSESALTKSLLIPQTNKRAPGTIAGTGALFHAGPTSPTPAGDVG